MTSGFRRRKGTISARFTPAEAVVLREAVAEVMELLGGAAAAAGDDPLAGFDTVARTPVDPVLARLLPDGYRDDPDAAGELRRLTESSLRAAKVGNALAVLSSLPADGGTVTLPDDEHAQAWVYALNDVRLALGTTLDVTEEMDVAAEVAADPDAARSYALVVYDWLAWLQDTLVRCMSVDR